jgi:hypothetical protein
MYGNIRQGLANGWDERIVEPYAHSADKRRIAQVASKDAGFGAEVEQYFERMKDDSARVLHLNWCDTLCDIE